MTKWYTLNGNLSNFILCCLQKELVTQLSTAKRDLNILAEKEMEYAKQAYNRSKEIKILRDRYSWSHSFFSHHLRKQKTLIVIEWNI